MRSTIRRILNEETNIKKNNICNIMSVDTYEEGLKLLKNYLGPRKENPEAWDEIKIPLKMWKEATIEIRRELDEYGMTGDSEVDESDTWWSAIQSTFCK